VKLPAPPGTGPAVAFPHQDEFAWRFFIEAVRHLGDARVLHRARRYAGAITSSQKAAELGMKAVLVLDGSLGWWDELQQTHRPLEKIEKHPVLTYHFQALNNYNPSLIMGLRALEKLAPGKPDVKEFKRETQMNAEYPFFYLEKPASPAAGTTRAYFKGPSEYFTSADSLDHYRTAYELLAAYQTLYHRVAAWKVRLPRPL
jgi:hypothetical protein